MLAVLSFTGVGYVSEDSNRDLRGAADAATADAESQVRDFMQTTGFASIGIDVSMQTLYVPHQKAFVHIITLSGDLPPGITKQP